MSKKNPTDREKKYSKTCDKIILEYQALREQGESRYGACKILKEKYKYASALSIINKLKTANAYV